MKQLHPWTLDPDEAIQLQESLRHHLLLTWDARAVNNVGGVDVRYLGDLGSVAIAVLTFPDMTPLDVVSLDAPASFPYIPGLLTFRLGPSILAAWEKLRHKPDLLMLHGHGIAHPRGLGLASHIGLWLGLPTIGIAKTRLYGIHSNTGLLPGEWSEVRDETTPSSVIGVVLRTRSNASPVYVSPGHLIDLQHSIDFVLVSCQGFRMPEPIRIANRAVASRKSCKQVNLS